MSTFHVVRVLSLSALLAASGPLYTARAQTPSGQIFGVITDPSATAVAGASITVQNETTNQQRVLASGVAGDYVVSQLAPGRYRLTVRHPGFKAAVVSDLELQALQNLRSDVQLSLGELAESVTVVSENIQVDTRGSSAGLLVDDKRVRELPLNGRNVLDLALLAPGVSSVGTTIRPDFGQQTIRVNGGRHTSTNFLLDGGSVNYFHRGQGLSLPPPDSIQEFKLITTGVTAEYGRGFAVLSAVTRSGSNELHGSLWEFLRNDAFDARSFFVPRVSKLRFNQFGGTLGGPIVKDRTFFFGSYQGLRIREDATASSAFVPSAAERTGDFSQRPEALRDPLTGAQFPGNVIPSSRIDPVARRLLETYVPAANGVNGQFVSQQGRPTTGDQFLGRIDHSINERNRLNGRYHWDYNRGLDPFAGGSNLPDYSPITTSYRQQVATIEDTHTFAPNLIAVFRVNFTRFNYLESNTAKQTLLELGATDFVHAGGPPTLPVINVTGQFQIGPGRDRQRLSQNVDLSANATYLRGRHEVKWGTDIQRNRFLYRDNRDVGGTFQFDGSQTGLSFADFLLGRARRLSQATPIETDQGYLVSGLFVQDTWKASSRLTLTLGLRAELFPRWKEKRGIAVGFVPGVQSQVLPGAPAGLVYQNDDGFPYEGDYNNFAPRAGFAWDIFGDGRTAIRGHYGISYDALTAEQASGVLIPQPFGLSYTLNNPAALSAPYAGTTNPFPFIFDPASARFVLPVRIPKAVDGGIRNPYAQTFGLNVQRQFASLLVDVGYVGTLGRKLIILREVNPAIPGPGATTANTNARRIYAPAFESIGGLFSDGRSNYHSLQVQVVRRWTAGLTFNANYTWSKSIDEAVSGGNAFATVDQGGAQNPFNRRADRALSDFDIRHRLAASFLYEIPFRDRGGWSRLYGGWELGGLVTAETGSPFTVVSGRDNSLTAVGFDRPDLIGDPRLEAGSRQESIQRYFNTEVFMRNADGQFGNAGRNILTGPSRFMLDTSLTKRFAISEHHSLQLRGDAFNILNRPNFSDPVASLASSNFGQITSAGAGRILQVSLKYSF